MKADHLALVQDEHRKQPPLTGPFSPTDEQSPAYQARLRNAFLFQQRVLARLAREFPSERWGYLVIHGENLIEHNGEMVKVGRVCGPDTQLYKIMTDIPTVNDPIWHDDGLAVNDHGGTTDKYYRPFEGGVIVDPPVDPPSQGTPGPPGPPGPKGDKGEKGDKGDPGSGVDLRQIFERLKALEERKIPTGVRSTISWTGVSSRLTYD